MKYPIAEVFHSIQGEGVWTGTPMMFVRLAGCNVGKYHNLLEVNPTLVGQKDFPLYEDMKHSICTTIDGQRFLCDTDYHRFEEGDPIELERECYEDHVCITGGEPFLHNLGPLADAFTRQRYRMVHIETSGTKPIHPWVEDWHCRWITCCPKEGFLEENSLVIDEWKFLVGPNFNEEITKKYPTRNIFLQPINGVNDIDEGNLARCLELLKKHPNWRLSAQLHKYLHLR